MSGLDIQVCSTTAEGTTPLSAFDAALERMGAHDFNLVRLSSVIPAGSQVGLVRSIALSGAVGDRLYCVWALSTAKILGEQAWAGLAWSTTADGRGVFVEHHGASEEQVHSQLDATVHELCARRDIACEPQFELAGGTCEEHPVAALVLASYEVEPWR